MDFFEITTLLNLLTLTGLEIVLGIDNVIFIALLVQHLRGKRRTHARVLGLSLALIFRILMLFGASWIMTLTTPLFTLAKFPITGRSLLLIIGGLFLVVKSAIELKEMFYEHKESQSPKAVETRFFKIIAQIIFIDIILSFDSIITAVGISNQLPVMVTAVVIAIIVMLLAANPIGNFIYENPSIKLMALAFIFLVGVFLTLSGIDIEIEKGYLYFAMFFSSMVEWMNIKLKRKNL
ncbi:MAG: TerC family protein [Pseudomonadota bacterium]